MKKNANKNASLLLPFFYICIFATAFYIIRCAPLLTDDYIFLSHETNSFKSAMLESLHYGNGRVLGNFLTLFFVNFQTAMDIERSLILTLLIAFLSKINEDKENRLLYLIISAVLVLGISPLIFSEVFSWASGFHNYVPPVLLLIVCYILVKNNEKSSFEKAISYVMVFVFGAVSQLFLELNTVVNICFTAFLVFYCFKKNREKLFKTSIWFLSTIIGGAIMFIIPKVFEPSNAFSNESYREIHLSNIPDIVFTVFNNSNTVLYILARCEIIFFLISTLLLFLMKKYKKCWKNHLLYKSCIAAAITSALFFLINCIIENYTVFTKFEIPHQLISSFVVLLLIIDFIVTAFHFPKSKEKLNVIICAFFAIFSICPMLVVTPFGNRCMFLSYIFIVVATIQLINIALKDLESEKIKWVCRTSSLAFAVLACCLIVTFSDIYWLDTQQIAYIEFKVKEKPSVVEVLNYESNYVYTDRTWGFSYCYYNENHFDIKFKDLPFAEWYKHRQAEGWY